MIFGDYHVHSSYSKDGKQTIQDILDEAVLKGLKEVAVTDHCYFHGYGIKRGILNEIYQVVDEMDNKTHVHVLRGIEANLIDQKGNIDFPKSEQDRAEIVILGVHKSFGKGLFKILAHSKLKKKDAKSIEKNTQSYITAMENNKINLLAHLNYTAKVDCEKIAKYCKEHNIYIELNGRKNAMSDEELRKVIDTGVQFIITSDAHNRERVGDVRLGLTLIEKFNIPEWQVANLNKLPDFNKRK